MGIIKLFLDKYEIEFFLLCIMGILPFVDSLLEKNNCLESLPLVVIMLLSFLFVYKVVICKSSQWAWGALGFYGIVIIPIGLYEYFAVQIENDSGVKVIYNLLSLFFVAIVLLRTCFRLENLKEAGGD